MIDWSNLGPTELVFCLGLLVGVIFTDIVRRIIARGNRWPQVREDTPDSHQHKRGTPSMGGIGIVVAILLGAVVVGMLAGSSAGRLVPLLGLMVVFAGLGLADDYRKLVHQTSTGLKARYRISIEFVVAAAFTWVIVAAWPSTTNDVAVLGFSGLPAIARIILGALVVVGSANAVNLTDGLDGLAAGLVALCAGSLAVICWVVGRPELALLSALVAGVSAGFLWFNAHPARIFMGDVGSLALGVVLGGIAVAAGVELLFALLAAVFVLETLSVIIQVVWFQTTGQRVFLMTPFHHGLELRGWAEPQIVTRLWLIGAVAAAVGLSIVAAVV